MSRLRRVKAGSPKAVRRGEDEEDLVKWFDNLNINNNHPQEIQPPAMDGELLPYQKNGLAWLKVVEGGPSKGGILADEAGLGKTAQIIALILATRLENLERKPNLVICPVSVLDHWEDELIKWVKGQHRLKVCVHHDKNKPSYEAMKSYDVVLTTYDIIARHGANLPFTGTDCSWHRLLCGHQTKPAQTNFKPFS